MFCLLDGILALCQDSGATLEEAIAAVRAAEAILPTTKIRSKNELVIET